MGGGGGEERYVGIYLDVFGFGNSGMRDAEGRIPASCT